MDRIRQHTGHHTAQPGQLTDTIRQHSRTPFGRIGHLAAVCLMLLFTSCGVTERITTERNVSVTQRDVAVPVPGSVRSVPFTAADLPQTAVDTLTFQDDRVRVTVRKSATQSEDLSASEGPDSVRTFSQINFDNYILDIEVFPDTITTTATDSVITERTETVVTETETGAFAWMVIGGLVAVVIVLLVAFRIRV